MSKKDNRWLVLTAAALTFSFLCRARAQTRAEHQTDSKPQVSDSSIPKQGPMKSVNDPTTHWQELKNKWGWKIRFPKDWKAFAPGEDDTPNTGITVWIQGPQGCRKAYFESGGRCGYVTLDIEPESYWDAVRKMTDSSRRQVGGTLAYDIKYVARNAGGWPQGEPAESIVAKHDDVVVRISYSEDAKDNAMIRSHSDWKFAATFDRILSTFSFIQATCRVGPCR